MEEELEQRNERPSPAAALAAIKQSSEVSWDLPTSYKKGMLVPARVYATHKLLNQMDAGVFEQVTNVACLPGIQKHAYCMPDGHWGYGFPIGGVAAFDIDEGIISPGGIGFDINCISGDSKILDEFGSYQTINDMESFFEEKNLQCMDLKQKKEDHARILLYMKKKPDTKVYKIKTLTGNEMIATADHPFLTQEGMKKLDEIPLYGKTAIYPFEGVSYEEPENKIIFGANEISKLPESLKTQQIIKELEKRNLIELKLNDKRVPLLAKIISYNMGDGYLGIVGKSKKGFAWFYGEKEDLENIRKDILRLGFTASKVYERTRDHKIQTKYKLVEFTDTEYSIKVSSRSFVVLMHGLGAPLGNKTKQDYGIPDWILSGPKWHQRLFLASYFGAEMSAPKTMTNNHCTFYMPAVGMNKAANVPVRLLHDIKELLDEFEIDSMVTEEKENYVNAKGIPSFRTRLEIYGDAENLIKLYSKIGYEYNQRKKQLSLLATHYTKLKEIVVSARQIVEDEVQVLYGQGARVSQLVELVDSPWANKRYIQRSLFEERKTKPRIPKLFPTFKEFSELATKELGKSGMVWDVILEKEEIEFDDYVYDFTVNHNDHNFIANSFVISNCGMRLLTTNLTFKEVQPKLKQLVETLFKKVPSGVGAKGIIKLNNQQFNEMMQSGSKWCIGEGMGWEEDLERTEEYGCIKNADPSKISEKAIARGINQMGTLGSGNHYLEVQVAGNIFDTKVAKKFGIIDDNQIVVMVHCGSRGFGHQVATDYLKTFGEAMHKYGITVRDRELACAPFSSKEGQDYYFAMACAANAAFANRQVIAHRIRESFSQIFNKSPEEMEMHQVYDVAHNIAKVEDHKVENKKVPLVVHRKGATRCFGPGEKELPRAYMDTGQPVIIGGSMETGSYLLVGMEKARQETFGSTAHGSGRTMSRAQAKHQIQGDELQKDMEKRGIYVKSASMVGLAEEAGFAYKDISEVVDTMEKAGVSKKVVALRPIGNIKG